MIQYVCELHDDRFLYNISDSVFARSEAHAAELYAASLPESARRHNISARRIVGPETPDDRKGRRR